MTDKNDALTAAPGKRRGLALPPRGQALTRLQDLEGAPPPALGDEPKAQNAVNTASSNAVTVDDANAGVPTAGSTTSEPAAVPLEVASPVVGALSPTLATRPAREPTTRITVDMPDSLHKRLSFLSVETRRSIKDLVIEALDVTYFRPDAGDQGAR